ncbi:NAD-dependent epimerase/dehydratase family protein [Streptomyces bambusae]|uniref:NAD-dependent epimerase/dehydratase family protein n=1 Tax=Streptomyces bambusae TaxID=1550616 RepID=UPI001CFFC532|nr:NAD-dependent epimerase/dehydratase family protein [Streptomyces bambusae]MCB5170134.1 NAD-dependent epimerase/dehydratase family protein [Streptomyces bambusae]
MYLLITGAAGFIGSALTQAWRTAGHTVTPLDNLSVTSRRPSPKGLLVRDVRSLTARDLDGFDTVVHLAALKSVPDSFDVGGFEHNVAVDRHMIHTFAGSTARRLLLASSCEVYGEQTGPLAESAPYAPRSPYAAGKVATEQLADIYRPHLTGGRQIGVVRFFNTYGPDEGDDAVVPAFLSAAADGRPLMIEGDGTQARDLTYVDDAVTMLTRILSTPELLPVVNCGSGHPVSVRDLADAVIRVTGHGTTAHTTPRINEIASFTADQTLFTRTYGSLDRTPLAKALAISVESRAHTPEAAGGGL